MQQIHDDENIQDTTAAQNEVFSEIQEDLNIREQRRRMFPRAALVGLGAGLTASLFRIVLAQADVIRNELIELSHQFPVFGWIFPLVFSTLGAISSVMLVRKFAPETSGSGYQGDYAPVGRTTAYGQVALDEDFAESYASVISGDPLDLIDNNRKHIIDVYINLTVDYFN